MSDSNNQQASPAAAGGKQNGIGDLRDMLFQTMRDLRSEDKPMDLDRAKALTEVAGKIIEAAKVEVDFVRVVGGSGSGFIPTLPKQPALPAPAEGQRQGVTVHKIKG